MRPQLALGLPVNCLDGAAGTVRRLVLLPGRRTPAYIVVKRGRAPRAREITVPVSCIVRTSPDVVELGLTGAELKAFPSYETKVRVGTYPPVDDPLANVIYPRSGGGYMVLRQRSVPDAAIEVRRGMPVRDARGRLLGKVDNVVVDRVHRQITYIIMRPTAPGGVRRTVPTGLVSTVKNGCVYLTTSTRRPA
jgi:sporulation protein YlmC with PRC-barrel domain